MTEPFAYQALDVKRIHRMGGRVLLGWEPGLGKSLASLLYSHNYQTGPVLVVCPAIMKYGWREEAQRHFGMTSEVLSGTRPPERDHGLHVQVTIINYDILRFWLPLLLKREYGLLVLDECHMTSQASKRTTACRKLARKIPKVLALSGTPMTNRPIDLFNVLNMLRPDLYPSRVEYGQRYCGARRRPWGMDYRGATRLKELNRRLQEEVMIRRLKEDVLKELPPKRRAVLPVELSGEGRKEYQKAHKDFVSWIKEVRPERARKALRAEALTRLAYLKQLAGSLKLPLVMEWVDEFLLSGEKLALFAVHVDFLGELEKRYGKGCVLINGEVEAKKRHALVERFKRDPSCKLFLGNVIAAGSCITLAPAAANSLTCELDWRPAVHSQVESRLHRIGAVDPVVNWYMIAKDTIEERLAKILERKQSVISEVIDGGGREGDLDVFDLLLEEMEKDG